MCTVFANKSQKTELEMTMTKVHICLLVFKYKLILSPNLSSDVLEKLSAERLNTHLSTLE